jgi:threonine/homoserine/homoserine lactone efflux protein
VPLETWFAFVAAAIVLLVIPGPTITLVIAYALGQGRRSAAAVVAGVGLGDFTALTLSLLGLGALLAASSTLFTVLKWAGAAYLVYLGVKLWRADPSSGTLAERASGTSVGRIFMHAYAVTALNPKSIVFFVAFVPQFIDLDAPYLPQATILVATFVTLASANAALYALLAAGARSRIADPRTLRFVNRAGASVLVGAAVATAALHRS